MEFPQVELPPPNGQQFRSWSPKEPDQRFDEEFWKGCNLSEFARLIRVFQEEVESVYPCLDTNYLISNAPEVIRLGQLSKDSTQNITDRQDSCIGLKDLQLARIAIATAMVIEGHGKSDNSTAMVISVERSVMSILQPSSGLKDLQLLILLVRTIRLQFIRDQIKTDLALFIRVYTTFISTRTYSLGES